MTIADTLERLKRGERIEPARPVVADNPLIPNFVVGFLFHADSVLLIDKLRPDWQRGLFNGVGGKIEKGERPVDTMVREFREETGLIVPIDAWQMFCVEKTDKATVYFFRAFADDERPEPKQVKREDEEQAYWIEVRSVLNYSGLGCVGNLSWLVPLARDPRPIRAGVSAGGDITELKTWKVFQP